jgi:hypothetical protein
MSAADTTLRVLTWVAGEEIRPGSEPLPSGDLGGAAELAAPSAVIREAVARVAALGAARLRLGTPFGDPRPPGLAACLIAAAAGARGEPTAAERVLLAAEAVAVPSGWDLVARHAVAHAVLQAGHLDADLAGLMRALSPLTGLTDRPVAASEHAAEDLLVAQMPNPAGRLPDRAGYDLAVRTLAAPAAGPEQAAWRAGLLARRRFRSRPFVLDVYETGMTLFGPEYQRRVRQARALLRHPADLTPARPLLVWWQALAAIETSWPAEIRKRSRITGNYVDGVRAYRQLVSLEAAAAAGTGWQEPLRS